MIWTFLLLLAYLKIRIFFSLSHSNDLCMLLLMQPNCFVWLIQQILNAFYSFLTFYFNIKFYIHVKYEFLRKSFLHFLQFFSIFLHQSKYIAHNVERSDIQKSKSNKSTCYPGRFVDFRYSFLFFFLNLSQSKFLLLVENSFVYLSTLLFLTSGCFFFLMLSDI